MSLLALPGVVVTATSATAAEQIDVPTRVVMEVSASRLLYNAPFEITGQVLALAPDGSEAPVPDGTVRLERKLKGKTAWRGLGTDTVANETYFFSVPAVANAKYRVAYLGGSYADLTTGNTYVFLPSSAAARDIWVARDLNATDVEPKPNKFFVKGNVNPGWGDKVITLERKTCKKCAWKVYSKQRTTRTGGYRFPIAFPSSGEWFYRVVVPATTTHLKSTSQVFRAWVVVY
jgi:hypothetical protein